MLAYLTGATGCVGRNLVDELLKDNWDIVCLHRKSSDLAKLDGCDVDFLEVDLHDHDSVMRAIPENVDAVFHAAGNVAHWPDPNQWKDNVLATRHLVNVSLAKGVKKFIFTSTGATAGVQNVYDSDAIKAIPSGYIQTKRESELEVRKAGVKGLFHVILQPIIVVGKYDYDNYSTLFKMKDLSIALPGKLEFCSADDIARAHIDAFHHGKNGESYYLGGDYLTWRDILKKISDVTGANPPKMVAPKPLLYVVSLFMVTASKITGKPPLFTPDLVSLLGGEAAVPPAEKEKARKDLGYVGGVKKGIEDCVTWLAYPSPKSSAKEIHRPDLTAATGYQDKSSLKNTSHKRC